MLRAQSDCTAGIWNATTQRCELIFGATVPQQQATPGTTVTTTVPVATYPTSTQPPGFFAPGWYRTIPGIALIAVGALVGYRFYKRRKA